MYEMCALTIETKDKEQMLYEFKINKKIIGKCIGML